MKGLWKGIYDALLGDFFKSYSQPATQGIGPIISKLWGVALALIMFGFLAQAVGLEAQGRRIRGWGLIGTLALLVLTIAGV